jgi:hypothetical protein
MAKPSGPSSPNPHLSDLEHLAQRAVVEAACIEDRILDAQRREAAARWGAVAGLLGGGLIATWAAEPEWMVAAPLLATIGWLRGRANGSFQRGARVARVLASELGQRTP